ncbi:hypothetical protein HOLleu_15698 [Holothuria leucospilota]|uniref:Uncharacterized protein n=1 Tax=Holothuria leucospilota TaxID=206669 RepID=A0A9Q1C460_HOLLE|nr:hypothetical protein HOLleu_15698 [Holothuria leucospilota]
MLQTIIFLLLMYDAVTSTVQGRAVFGVRMSATHCEGIVLYLLYMLMPSLLLTVMVTRKVPLGNRSHVRVVRVCLDKRSVLFRDVMFHVTILSLGRVLVVRPVQQQQPGFLSAKTSRNAARVPFGTKTSANVSATPLSASLVISLTPRNVDVVSITFPVSLF